MKKIVKIPTLLLWTPFFLLLIFSIALILPDAEQKEDFKVLETGSYDTAFLSMFPSEHFSMEPLTYYRGMQVFRAMKQIENLHELRRYLKHITNSDSQITTVYLGVCPDLLTPSDLDALAGQYPDMQFEVILACPSQKYWQSISHRKNKSLTADYCDLITFAYGSSNLRLYIYSAEEWLVCNPALYHDDTVLSEEAASYILNNSDCLHPYMITTDNAFMWVQKFMKLQQSLSGPASAYPDLTDTAIVFFGDSIIGNYTGGTSIPGVVGGLSGATVYNMGYGGNSAAMTPDTPISLPGITEAFFRNDLSLIPQDKQTYSGIQGWWQAPPTGKEIIYVINYGLNDYFEGLPIDSGDPYDIATFAGAIRSTVLSIKEEAPDSQILLCTPTYSARPSNVPEVRQESYVSACISLAEELDIISVDNYHDLGINETNYTDYLPDQTHPNPQARFMIAENLLQHLKK